LFNGLRNFVTPLEIKPTQYNIYPTLGNGNLFLEVSSKSSNLNFQLYDLTGRLVWIENINNNNVQQIQLNTLLGGTYIASISDANKILKQQKLIIY